MRGTRPYTIAMWGFFLSFICYSLLLSQGIWACAYNGASQIKIKNGYFNTINSHL